MKLVLAALLAGCSDYEVAHSDLTAQAESGEILLAAGESRELMVRMEADAEAMGGNPSSWADFTIFAVQESGSPRLYASTAMEAFDTGVAPTAFLDLKVDGPFRGCTEEEITEPAAEPRDDGSCEVRVPVTLLVEGGSVSFQLDAYVQLNFASQDPPGDVTVSVE